MFSMLSVVSSTQKSIINQTNRRKENVFFIFIIFFLIFNSKLSSQVTLDPTFIFDFLTDHLQIKKNKKLNFTQNLNLF